MDDPVDQGERGQHYDQQHVVQRRGVVQFQPSEQGAARHALQPVFPPGGGPAQRDEVNDLRQGQRDHGEINPPALERQEAEKRSQRPGNGNRRQECEFCGEAMVLDQECRCIGGNAIEGRMPERQQSAVAENQVERCGEQCHRQCFHEKDRIDGQRGHGQHANEQQQQEAILSISHRQPFPSRPAGRNISTRAIAMNTATPAPSG